MSDLKKIKNKKILFVVTQTKWGGAQKYVLELAEYFTKNNEVYIAYGEIKKPNKFFLEKCRKLKIETIPVENLVRDISPGFDMSAVIEMFKKILHDGNYDLVHLNSSKVGLIGALASKLYGFNPMNTRLRVVYTAHGFVFNEPRKKMEKKLYTFSEKFSTALHSLIVTVSDYDKKSAVENKICPEWKMLTIHNGVNPVDYGFLTKEKALEKLGLNSNKKYFGTVASFYDTKGHIYLLEAIQLLKEQKSSLIKNYKWIFIGDGPRLEIVKEKANELKIENHVIFVKPQVNDWQYLKAFDIFVLPSVKEGLPYTILEAGLANIPVIASKVGGIPEIIDHKKTGYLTTPANPLSLKEAMRTLAKDKNLADSLADNNAVNVRENFSLQKMLNKTEEAYLKLFPS